MGGAVRGLNSQPRDRDDGRRGKRRPVLLLAAGPSSAVTMGKLSSTWCSANNHCGALSKPPLLSGLHIHLKLAGWIITWQFLKCRALSTFSNGRREQRGGRALGSQENIGQSVLDFFTTGFHLAFKKEGPVKCDSTHLISVKTTEGVTSKISSQC